MSENLTVNYRADFSLQFRSRQPKCSEGGKKDKMDRYKVLDLIGEGSFGRVFRGVHRETGASVALKLIPKVDHSFGLFSLPAQFLSRLVTVNESCAH